MYVMRVVYKIQHIANVSDGIEWTIEGERQKESAHKAMLLLLLLC